MAQSNWAGTWASSKPNTTWSDPSAAWYGDYGYTVSAAAQSANLNGKSVAAAVKELELQNRERIIQDFLVRTRMWKTEGEMLPFKEFQMSSCRKIDYKFAEEITFVDSLTGRYYQIIRDMRDRNYPYYASVDQNAFSRMDYNLKVYDEMKKWSYADFGMAVEPKVKEDPVCKSCKTKHAAEKLDLIGRCSVKLKSHNEKLRKLYWSHKKNIK